MKIFLCLSLVCYLFGILPQMWAAKVHSSSVVHSWKELDTPPKVLKATAPEYPKEWISDGISGKVTLRFTVSAKGKAEDFEVIHSDHELLTESAIDCVREWKFSPGKLNGKAAACRIQQDVGFNSRKTKDKAPTVSKGKLKKPVTLYVFEDDQFYQPVKEDMQELRRSIREVLPKMAPMRNFKIEQRNQILVVSEYESGEITWNRFSVGSGWISSSSRLVYVPKDLTDSILKIISETSANKSLVVTPLADARAAPQL